MTRRTSSPDARVLHMLADAHGRGTWACRTSRSARAELDRLGAWDQGRAPPRHRRRPGSALPRPGSGEAVLAGHRLLLDQGLLQEGDDALAGTRHAAVARLSAATAAETGVEDGDPLAVTGPAGHASELPLQVTAMPDRVVWLPLNSVGGGVASDTGALPGPGRPDRPGRRGRRCRTGGGPP